jgi:polyisoprenoid-binding protein YceI
MNAKRRTVVALTAIVAITTLAALSAAQAEQRVLVLDPVASKVGFTLDATGHDVEGTLAVKSGRIEIDSETGAASGEIVLDLQSAQTGNDSRDKTMHEDVFETKKFPTAVFHAEKVEGTVALSGTSQVNLVGTLSFHGGEHKLKLPAKVDAQNGRITADTQLTIPYVEWGLHDPSIMILRVAKIVQVHVHAQGSMEAGGASAGTH